VTRREWRQWVAKSRVRCEVSRARWQGAAIGFFIGAATVLLAGGSR